MDTKTLLDELLNAGRELGQQAKAKGSGLADSVLDLPDTGPERDAALAGLGKGAAAAGVLALLLGTDGGRKLTGTAIKLGSVAALGGVAWKAWQNWQAKQVATPPTDADAPVPRPVDALTGEAADLRSLRLLRAMIAAARADGHVDDEEQRRIEARLGEFDLPADAMALLQAEMQKPLQPNDVADGVTDPEEAAEIYLASLTVIDLDNFLERAWMDELARALALPDGLVQELYERSRA
ncbi:MAG: tellurite resistance TerB family protein [Pseudomonadota bacterium]